MLAPAAGVGAADPADAAEVTRVSCSAVVQTSVRASDPPRAPSLPLARREDAGQPRDFSGVIFPFAKRVN